MELQLLHSHVLNTTNFLDPNPDQTASLLRRRRRGSLIWRRLFRRRSLLVMTSPLFRTLAAFPLPLSSNFISNRLVNRINRRQCGPRPRSSSALLNSLNNNNNNSNNNNSNNNCSNAGRRLNFLSFILLSLPRLRRPAPPPYSPTRNFLDIILYKSPHHRRCSSSSIIIV